MAERVRADDWVGEVLGERWRVVEVLDRWGPGLAFDARRISDEGAHDDDEPVLLKMLPASTTEGASAKTLSRVIRCVHALAGDPPVQGVVPVRDQGEDEGVIWVVTDDLEAEPLARVVAQAGALPVRRAVRLLMHVCDALAGAHRRGVAHGGLTAEAVQVSSAGAPFERAWIADFGLAGRLSSPNERAPEARRDPDKAEPRTDVWALGRLLAMCVDDPDDPDHPDVASLIRWCMSRDRSNRPKDLRVVRRELDRLLSGRQNTPWEAVVRAGRRAPRTSLWASLAAVLGVVVALGATSLLTDVPADQDFARGRRALSAGDAAGAILAFESALRRTPGRSDALLGLAQARDAMAMPLAAEDAWRRLLAVRPNSVQAQLGLGRRLLEGGKAAAAAEHAAAAAAGAPADPNAHSLHGRALLAAGRPAAAALALERAAALAPTDADVHHLLGSLLADNPERLARAEEALATAARLAPGVASYKEALNAFRRRFRGSAQ